MRGSGISSARFHVVSIRARRHRRAMPPSPDRHHGIDPVSIRARRHRRAMRGCRSPDASRYLFQSAPVVTDGRCVGAATARLRVRGFNPRPSSPTGDAVQLAHVVTPYVVSIRARRHRRAMLPSGKRLIGLRMFQSAPVVTDGRCRRLTSWICRHQYRFNPRPSSPTGDAPTCPFFVYAESVFQSAPVVTDGRCIQSIRRCVDQGMFQSAPVVTDGRCIQSIRRCVDQGMFQSAPVVTDGRCAGHRLGVFAWDRFQSAPVVTDGRCSHRPSRSQAEQGFNPRPSSPTGDASSIRPARRSRSVSIRARRHRRAMPDPGLTCSAQNRFQSAPVVTDGRCAARELLRHDAHREVSIRARRHRRAMPRTGHVNDLRLDVSIRARRHRRAMPAYRGRVLGQ